MSLYLLGECSQGIANSYPVQNTLTTDQGTVQFEGPVTFEHLRQLSFCESLNNFRPAQKQKIALETLAGDPDGMVFIARFEETIIGYVTFHDPDFPWWKNAGVKGLVELGGLEIAPSWRGSGVSSAFFKSLFDNEQYAYFNDKIVMNIQTIHCWDLCNSNKSPWGYRDMMKGMLGKYGFQVEHTADPEIREHLANMLMVRMGENVSRESKEAFLTHCTSSNRMF